MIKPVVEDKHLFLESTVVNAGDDIIAPLEVAYKFSEEREFCIVQAACDLTAADLREFPEQVELEAEPKFWYGTKLQYGCVLGYEFWEAGEFKGQNETFTCPWDNDPVSAWSPRNALRPCRRKLSH